MPLPRQFCNQNNTGTTSIMSNQLQAKASTLFFSTECGVPIARCGWKGACLDYHTLFPLLGFVVVIANFPCIDAKSSLLFASPAVCAFFFVAGPFASCLRVAFTSASPCRIRRMNSARSFCKSNHNPKDRKIAHSHTVSPLDLNILSCRRSGISRHNLTPHYQMAFCNGKKNLFSIPTQPLLQ